MYEPLGLGRSGAQRRLLARFGRNEGRGQRGGGPGSLLFAWRSACPSPSPGPAWIAAFVEKHLPARSPLPAVGQVTSSNGDEDGEYLPGHCQEARGHATEFNGWAKAIESGCWEGHADPDSNTGERGERGEREKGHEHHASVDEQPVTARQIRLRENRLAPSEPLASCRPETEQRS